MKKELEAEVESTLEHIDMLLEDNERTSFNADFFAGDLNSLIEALEKNYNVEKNGTMLYIKRR